LLAVCLVQVVAVHAQLFLGVRSETNASLLAYHIPLGVLILVLTYLIAGPSFGVTRETRLA
jgi:hypothetical protein